MAYWPLILTFLTWSRLVSFCWIAIKWNHCLLPFNIISCSWTDCQDVFDIWTVWWVHCYLDSKGWCLICRQTTGIPSTTPSTSTSTVTGTGSGSGTGIGAGTGTPTALPGSTTPGVFSPTGMSPLGSTDPNYNGSPSLLLYPGNFFSFSVALFLPCLLVLWG